MPASLFLRIDLDKIYFPFLEKCFDVIADCRVAGHDYFATMGFRTYAEQNKLYAQGRSAPGSKVTKAIGGESAHNFGLAIDFTHDSDVDRPGLQPDWRAPNYEPLGRIAKLHGLVWGGSFNDRPHVQWPGYVTGAQLAPLRAIMGVADSASKLRAVWAHLDKGTP